MDTLVLCFHVEGGAHVEWAGKKAPEVHAGCCDSEPVFSQSHCPPCTDLVLNSTELPPMRANELVSLELPVPLPVGGRSLLFEANRQLEKQLVEIHPPRGPPELEPVAELIRRTTVLRL